MKKKTIANIAMCVVIFVIAVVGILLVGHVKGWFDKQDENVAILTDIRGIVIVEREDIAYIVKEDSYLRSGDKISCDAGSTVRIMLGEDSIVLGQNAKAEVMDTSVSAFRMNVELGEVFVNTDRKLLVCFENKQVYFENTVASLSVRSGAQSISVFAGTVEGAESGQLIEWVGEETFVRECSIQSLNAFHIAELRKANGRKELVFSNEELDQLEADRWQAIVSTNQSKEENESKNEASNTDMTKRDDASSHDEQTADRESSSNNDALSSSEESSDSEEVSAGEDSSDREEASDNEDSSDKEEPSTEEKKLSCTITIRCDTILNNWDNLEAEKAPYVPTDGCILPVTAVEFTEGETVFDVLKRVCETYGIQIEYSWTPMYDSYYIEGINNLYEFDCGSESGWMYKVNEWFPNYGCSSYELTGGETIVWCYTCVGLGTDVGAEGWN